MSEFLTPSIIVVDREDYELDLYALKNNRYHRVKRYPIAVGAIGTATPHGMYFVEAKTREPDWINPEGELIAFEDERNPFEGGFLSLAHKIEQGIGIHGVRFDPKLGTRASRGCVRMATPDFMDIYERVPKNTPVYVH